jgi:hypothetical protein
LDAGSNVVLACNFNDEISLYGLDCDAGGRSGVIFLAPGSYSARLMNLTVAYGYGAFVDVGAGVALSLSGATATCFTSGAPGIVCGGTLCVSDVAVADATIGLHVLTGATARIGANVALDGSTTALSIDDGGFVSTGTIPVVGALPIQIPWPQLTSTDCVWLVPLSYLGTPSAAPCVTITPGVGFTVTGSDDDNGTYTYYVGSS